MTATGRDIRSILAVGVTTVALAWSAAAFSVTFSAEEMTEIGNRMALARGIVDQVRPRALADRYSEGWDTAVMATLLNRTSEELASMKTVRSLSDVNSAVAQLRAPGRASTKNHGFATNNMVFHSISPCRLLDTRNAIGILGAGVTRTADMSSSSSQGGAAGCSTSIRAADPVIGDNSAWGALALNATVANTAAGPAFLRLRPAGSTNASAWLNWVPANAQVANAGILALDSGGSFEMFASSSTDVIIDVFGAFGKTNQMTCSEVYNSSSSTVDPDSFVSISDASIVACPANSADVGYIWDYISGSGGLAPWQQSRSGGGLGFTHVRPSAGSAGSTITFTPGRRCCSIPDVSQ